MLAPAWRHIAEELWERIGHEYSVHQQQWPRFDPALTRAETVEIAVQVSGKLRGRVHVPADAGEAQVRSAAEAETAVAGQIAGKEIVRVIYVPGRLINLVVR